MSFRKNSRKPDGTTPTDSFQHRLKAAYDKVINEVVRPGSNETDGLESANDFFIGLLLTRILEETHISQKSGRTIGKLWSQYNREGSASGFHTLFRNLMSGANQTTSGLNLIKLFSNAMDRLDLSDESWSFLIDEFLYANRFGLTESNKENGSIGPDVLASTNEFVSQRLRQKSSGVFYTSTSEARLVAELALGHWINGKLYEFGCRKHKESTASILRSVLTASAVNLHGIDCGILQRLSDSLLEIKIIDPACGSGTLLVEIFKLLLTVFEKVSAAVGAGFDKEEIGKSIIEKSLFGFDTDSRAIAIAEARLFFCLNNPAATLIERPIRTKLSVEDGLLGDLKGADFDIVIGNPPFVRHENINSANINRESYARELRMAVKKVWPGLSINGRADLHTFFFYLGVSMLKPGGVVCYIAPNAWLDVDYGEQLREFLLRHTDLHLLLNPSQRRFAAGVNTLIVVASAGDIGKRTKKDSVLFMTPAQEMKEEDILSAAFSSALKHRNDCRLVTRSGRDQVDGGQPYLQNGKDLILTASQRWGIYFRAPDIFFDLMSRLDGCLKPLGRLGKVRYPLKTGINEFFFVTQDRAAGYGIESQYLVPVVKSTREFTSYILEAEPKTFLFSCDKSLSELKALRHRGALDYIKWGAGQSTKLGIPWSQVASVSHRKEWYAIPRLDPAHILCNRFFDRRFFFGCSARSVIEDQTFYGLTLNGGERIRLLQAALLNSSLSYLLVELFGRVSLGEGLLQYAKYEMDSLPALDALELSSTDGREIVDVFTTLTKRPIEPIFTEMTRDDRQRFDLLIGRKIGLTDSQVRKVSSALTGLVRLRLDKATSIRM